MAWNNYNSFSNPALQSKYHGSFQKLDRLDQLWQKISQYWRAGQLAQMNHELESIWSEFYPDASSGARQFHSKINKLILRAFARSKTSRDRTNKIKYLNLAANLIKTKRNFLTIVEKKQGLGKKYQDQDEDLF